MLINDSSLCITQKLYETAQPEGRKLAPLLSCSHGYPPPFSFRVFSLGRQKRPTSANPLVNMFI